MTVDRVQPSSLRELNQILIEMTKDFKCVAEIRIQGTNNLTNIQDHLEIHPDDPESNIKPL